MLLKYAQDCGVLYVQYCATKYCNIYALYKI